MTRHILSLFVFLAVLLSFVGGVWYGKHQADRWWEKSFYSNKEFLYIYNVSFPEPVTFRAKQVNMVGNYFDKGVTFADGAQVSSAGDVMFPINPNNEPMATWCSDLRINKAMLGPFSQGKTIQRSVQ